MKKNILIGIFALVILNAVLVVTSSNASANTLPESKNVFVANSITGQFFALQAVTPMPLPEEERSNLPYIISGILVFALIFEVVLYKRKRDKEKKEKGQVKGKPSANVETPDANVKAKHKRYGKEQMSEILKASASMSKKSPTSSADETEAEEETQPQVQPQFSEKPQEQPQFPKLDLELKQSEVVEELPEVVDDDTFYDALVDSEDVEAMIRAVSARVLARHKTVNSIKKLSKMAMDDADPEVRLEAVEGLKTIGHVSVFAPLLIAVSDDYPTVKQAAIQAFTSLSLNMADNYVRLIESGDEEIMKKVARACLVTGLVHKAFVQLCGNNQEQAYEGFALLSLLAKAGETKPLVDAITKHPNMNVRILAIRIMNETQKPEAHEQLKELMHESTLPKFIKTSLVHVVRQNASVN